VIQSTQQLVGINSMVTLWSSWPHLGRKPQVTTGHVV